MEVNIFSRQGTLYFRSMGKLNICTCFSQTDTSYWDLAGEFLSSQINIFIYLFIYVKDDKHSKLAIDFESVQILQCHSSQSLLHGIIELLHCNTFIPLLHRYHLFEPDS